MLHRRNSYKFMGEKGILQNTLNYYEFYLKHIMF